MPITHPTCIPITPSPLISHTSTLTNSKEKYKIDLGWDTHLTLSHSRWKTTILKTMKYHLSTPLQLPTTELENATSWINYTWHANLDSQLVPFPPQKHPIGTTFHNQKANILELILLDRNYTTSKFSFKIHPIYKWQVDIHVFKLKLEYQLPCYGECKICEINLVHVQLHLGPLFVIYCKSPCLFLVFTSLFIGCVWPCVHFAKPLLGIGV